MIKIERLPEFEKDIRLYARNIRLSMMILP